MTNEHHNRDVEQFLRSLDPPSRPRNARNQLRHQLLQEEISMNTMNVGSREPISLRERWMKPTIAAAAVVALVAGGTVVIQNTSTSVNNPIASSEVPLNTSLAAQVRDKTDQVLATATSLKYKGSFWFDSSEDEPTMSGDLSVTFRSDGSLLESAISNKADDSYTYAFDAKTQTATMIRQDAEGVHYSKTKNEAPQPDRSGLGALSFFRFSPSLRTAIDEGIVETTEVNYQGKAAWQLSFVDNKAGGPAKNPIDRTTLVIDKETSLPVHQVSYTKGVKAIEITIDELRLNSRLSDDTFTLAQPAGSSILELDSGFRTVEKANLSSLVSYAIPFPEAIPTGFQLDGAYFSPKRGEIQQLQGNKVVELVYRRGIETLIIVSAKASSTHAGEAPYFPPHTATGEVRPTNGYFAGRTLRTTEGSDQQATIYGSNESVMITVVSSLDLNELTKVVESLQPLR